MGNAKLQYVQGRPIFTNINEHKNKYPYLTKNIDTDVCIIGGGITGAITSYYFSKENNHSAEHTKDLKEVTKRADILIVAIGKPKMITADYVKEGAVVIDVGIHRPEGGKLCGDVDFDSVEKTASAITPVPGGVGPMTIAMLMNNCVEAKGIQKA